MSTSTPFGKHVRSRIVCLVVLALALLALGGAPTPPVHASTASLHGPFVSRGERAVGFGPGEYDSTRPLFINPTLTWNTFLGGTGWDAAKSIAVDLNGNAYIVGYSNLSWGSPVRNFGTQDAFVAKVSSTGALVWNTFLGGSGFDSGEAIALDGNGNVYVAGYSYTSWGGPGITLHAFSGGHDAFVAKLDSNGVLLWNTFLGGSGVDEGFGIAVDASGNIYVSGNSYDTWQGTSTPVRAFSGLLDAFAAKLNSSGTLLWNTFLGGTAPDTGMGIAVDQNGNVYLTGKSEATWPGAIVPLRVYGGGIDAYAAKLASDGGLTWYTFLGGGGIDNADGVAVDATGNIYVAGSSTATWGVPVRLFTGTNFDGFAAKLNSSGTLLWNSFLGGSGVDYASAVAVDPSGNSYVTGESMAAWGSPLNPYNSGDAYVAKLDSNGGLSWNTFTGGSVQEVGNGIGIDGDGNVYLGGISTGTWGSPIRPYSSDIDAFVAKIQTAVAMPYHVYLPLLIR